MLKEISMCEIDKGYKNNVNQRNGMESDPSCETGI
jgi:hypothetical protein